MNTNVDVPSPEPGPKPQLDLRRALNHAVKVAQYLSTSDVLDEETLTGSILGALSASLGFCVEPRDTDPIEASKKFFWARYNKGTARKNEHSEARNGADFALVLINEHGIRRLAIFQAKKGKVSRPDPTKPKWKIDTYREGKDEKEHPRTQIEALVRASTALMERNLSHSIADVEAALDEHAGKEGTGQEGQLEAAPTGAPLTVDGLSWVHYVAYCKGAPLCIPVSEMQDVLERSLDFDEPDGKFEFDPTEVEFKTLFQVLENGLAADTPQWLTIQNPEAMKAVPKLLDLMPIFAAGNIEGFDHLIGMTEQVDANEDASQIPSSQAELARTTAPIIAKPKFLYERREARNVGKNATGQPRKGKPSTPK